MHHFHKVHINLWLVLGALLVVFTWGWWSIQQSIITPVVEIANVPVSVAKKITSSVRGSSTPSISYEDAVLQYKDARIQFDADCKAFPKNMTFKEGRSIMIDNRASVSRSITAGSTFTVKGYGFKIIKLSSATLPVTWFVNCDGSKQVATILIQK